MTTIKITWSSGAEEVVETEHATVDAYVNERFGSAWEHAVASGVTVEIVPGDDFVMEEDPA